MFRIGNLRKAHVVSSSRGLSLLFGAMTLAISSPLCSQALSSATAAPVPLLIGVGDSVSVGVFDTPSLTFQDRVDESGNVRAPVLGAVHIAGLTTEQAARLFEDKLRSGQIMQVPSVTVQDAEYATQGIVVLGQVHNPGTFTLLGPHTLYDAISAAGGVLDTEGPSITITHHGDAEHPEVVAVNSPNFSEVQRTTRVYPGDTVFISKADVIYVIGDVGRSGSYYIQNGRPLSVLNVLSLAGGENPTATDKKASIVRQTPQGVQTIAVNIHDIKRNQMPDLAMLPNDILVVPRSGLKVFETNLLPGATAGVISAVVSASLVR